MEKETPDPPPADCVPAADPPAGFSQAVARLPQATAGGGREWVAPEKAGDVRRKKFRDEFFHEHLESDALLDSQKEGVYSASRNSTLRPLRARSHLPNKDSP